jgi:hypothetical protein
MAIFGQIASNTDLLASTTTSGTVKIDVTDADPIVYTKASADTLLALKAPLASPTFTGTVKLNSHYGDITADTDASTITFNMATSDKHSVTLGANRTLAVSNDQIGQGFVLFITQDGTGSRTVTWWSGIKWQGGTTPTLTTTATKTDVFSFIKIGSGSYLGMAALNF